LSPRRAEDAGPRRGDVATGALILDTALSLFRRRGFLKTTMREVAKAAGVSLGAAYHYFPSKQALVLAYFARRQEDREQRTAERIAALGRGATLADRIAALFHANLDVFAHDRKLLGALFGGIAPDDPSSPFGSGATELRQRGIFEASAVLDHPAVPPEVRPLLGSLLWMLMIGHTLFFVRDRSAGQAQSRGLIDATSGLLAAIVATTSLPQFAGVRDKARELARLAGVVDPQRGPAR
jgi:AcrR family transcriptional regulator